MRFLISYLFLGISTICLADESIYFKLSYFGLRKQESEYDQAPAVFRFEAGRPGHAKLEIAVPGTNPVEYAVPEELPHEWSGEVIELLHRFYASREDLAIHRNNVIARGSYVGPNSVLGRKFANNEVSDIEITIGNSGPAMESLLEFFKTDEGRRMFRESGGMQQALRKLEGTFPDRYKLSVYVTTINYYNSLTADGSITTKVGVDRLRDLARSEPWNAFEREYSARHRRPLYLSDFKLPWGGVALQIPFRGSLQASENGSLRVIPEIELYRAALELRDGKEMVQVPELSLNSLTLGYADGPQFARARQEHYQLFLGSASRGASPMRIAEFGSTAKPNLSREHSRELIADALSALFARQSRVEITVPMLRQLGCGNIIEEMAL